MLESYITPLLMGYVNKYIKNLKPSDLSLSVWGGDVVLQNLELNLDVLQKELNLPVHFLSGRIHELQIHVPWTRITYEPVTITINTIEFVVKLRDPDDVEVEPGSDETEKSDAKEFKKEMQKAKVAREAEHLPPGYVQGVVNKVINNISICVNNLILKYVEDDIVFSLNVKSIALFSANEDWEQAFVELTLPSLCLRKICNISNLTVCLDSRNADGKIEMYQDPILYKCNLSCRLLSKYMGLGSISAYENQLNVYCESLDLSSTDVQLPMIIRLLTLCTGLYYRTLDLPGCKYKLHPAEEMMERRRHLKHASESYTAENIEKDGQLTDTGWVSWAWSMIPNIQDGGNKLKNDFIFDEDSVLLFGIYITQCSLTLKVTNEAHNSSIVGSKRFEFSPVLNIEMSGCAVEVISKGEEYFDCQFGICNIVGYMIGDCLCKSRSSSAYNIHANVSLEFDEPDREYEDELLFQVGCPKDTAQSGVGFLEDSLFRQPKTTFDNKNDASCYQKTVLPEKGKQFTEAKVTQKFGACFMDYLYIMELPKETASDLDDSGAGVDNSKGNDLVKEVSSKRVIVGAINLFITSRLCHLISRIQGFCQDDAPQRKMKSGVFIDKFVMDQLKLGNFSTRGLHITFNKLKASIIYPDHVFGRADGRNGSNDLEEQDVLSGVLFQIDRADYQATSPMFPNELNALLLQADCNAKPIFYRAAYTDHFIKFFGVQLGVCQYRHEFSEPVVLNVMPPMHASAYAKVFIGNSSLDESGKYEFRIKIPSFTIGLIKAQLMMMIELAKSWTRDHSLSFNQFLVDDVFSPKEKSNSSSIVQASIIGIDLKYVQTDLIHAICGSIGSIKASQQSLVKGVPFEKALVYGPLDTSKLNSLSSFLDKMRTDAEEIPNGPLMSFTFQIPLDPFSKFSANVYSVARIDLKGIVAVLDADLLKWLEYQPSTAPRKRQRTTEKRLSKILSRSFSASTPRKKSYARILGNSPSKTSKEHKYTKQDSESASTGTSTRENRLTVAMAILKSIVLKIDIQTSVAFFPVDSMCYGPNFTCPDHRIAFAFREAFADQSSDTPNTLVVAFPNVNVCSSNCKIADLSGDIPLRNASDGHKDNSLPWTLSGDGLSIYVLSSNAMHANQDVERHHIWYPAPWTMLLAAADADPKTPDDPKSPLPLLQGSMTRLGVNTFADALPFEARSLDINYQPSLGFCVHIDLTSVKIGISKLQAEVVIQLLSRFMKTLETITNKNVNEASSQQLKDKRNLTETASIQNIAHNGEVDRRSASSASTVEHPDGISISTEASVFSGEAEMRAIENIKVSLWLQWIIPKVSVTFYGEPSPGKMRPWYRIPCEIEDISLAFDYQQGEIRMKSKVGSIAVNNFFIRPGGNEWECDKFGGALLSCDDILAHNVKTLPMLQNSSPRAFLILNYTRQPLSCESLRKRYTSVRSEATIPPESVEQPNCHNERALKYSIVDDYIYQHKLEVAIQSFDILFAIEPVLSVLDSFLVLRNPFGTKIGKAVKAVVMSDEADCTREGGFQPLPILDLDSKGFRVVVPLLDVKKIGNDFEEDTIIFFVHSLLIKSDPLNRISSTILHKDWYRQLRKHQREKNRRTKFWHVQYQVDLNCMSLWSGKWGDICVKNHRVDENDLTVNSEGQNPALEWNYQLPTDSHPIKLRPLLQGFNCRSTLSPALKILKKDFRGSITISASSLEVNFSKDIIAFCNPFQVNLLTKIVNQTVVSVQSIGLKRAMTDSSMNGQVLKSPDIIDSGISSVMSLKGTSDLKSSPEPDLHFAEKTPEIHSPSSFELFISGSKISLSLYVPEVSNGREFFEDSQIYKLVGYADIIQPTLDIRDDLLQVTVYDASIALPGCNKSSNILPDRSLFDDMVLGTLKGKQNEKTGLFASALSIKASMKDKIKVTISIDRPLQVNLALEMTTVFNLFTSKLAMIDPHQPHIPKAASDSNQAQMSFTPDEIAVQTCRVNVTLAGTRNSHVYRLLTAHRSINILLTMKHQGQLGESDTFSYKCDVDGFEINLSRDDSLCRLLSPCIFGIEGEMQTIRSLREPDARHVQRMIVFINSGLVHVQVGPLHLKYLTAIFESVGESLPSRSSPKGGCDAGLHEGTNSQGNIVEYSKDDLKTGSFDYIVHSGEETGHPLANQIIFNEEDSDRPPCMTWRYPVPRFLNEITVMPLPFHIDEVMPGDDLAEIPCVIRYWDHIEQTYVTYRHFFLSQSRSETMSLPNPLLDVEGACQVASEEWQVVVDVAHECESDKSETGSIPDDILREVSSVYKTPVSATSLAACIKINSCYIPEKIPRFMCSFAIGCIQLIILNNFNTSENVQPRLFAPFYLDSFTYPSNQEACCLELKSFQCKGSLSGGSNSVKSFITEFDVSLDVMNYRDLSWRKFLDMASFAGEIFLATTNQVGTENLDLTQSKLNMAIDSVKLITSQCIIHTLSLTVDNWKRGREIDVDIPLLNHYIICNETEDVLRFGQVDTDEDILLASGQMYPYSWRSSHNQMMHLCVDSIGDWRWCAPFDIDCKRGCTRTIKHSTHCSLVHIEIRQKGGLQKQIIFRGGLFFRNCLKTDVSFEVFLQHVTFMGHLSQQKVTQVPKSFIVPAEAARPSMSFTPGTLTSIYLRLISNATQGPWSSATNLTIKEDLCIPLTLAMKDEDYNVWFTVTRIYNEQYSQLQICICPFFIARNHLPWPVLMTATARDEGKNSLLGVQGRGHETEVLNLANDVWYNVSFQLEGTKECTDPPIPINTTFLDILKKKRKLDLQYVDYSAEWPYKDGCSISEEQPPSIIPNRNPKPNPETPAPDLQCQLLQRWEYLPTIVIEIKPKFILNNQSQQSLFVRDAETHLVWGIERNAVISSPAFQTSIQFGRAFDGRSELEWSSLICLSELEESAQSYSRDSSCLYQHSSISFSIFNPARSKCLQFTLTSRTHSDMIIISIRERFRIYNSTDLRLRCFPVLCENEELPTQVKDSVEIVKCEEPHNISEVTLIKKENADSKKEPDPPDLSKFSIRFFFYDCESSPGLFSDAHLFDLSRDHLRENITLRKWDEEPICVAMTSYMKDGVINIFLDRERYPSILFHNKTHLVFNASVSFNMKEHELESKRTDDKDRWESEIEIGSKQRVCYQCKSFRDSFPKIGNVLHGRLKMVACINGEATAGKLLLLHDEDKTEEILIGTDKVIISIQKVANCFYVLLNNEVPDYSLGRRPMNLPVVCSTVNRVDVMVVDDVLQEEVFDLSIDKLSVQHDICTRGTCSGNSKDSRISIKIGGLQVDNQSTDDYDHFPVVVLPLREVSQRYRGDSPHNAPFGDTHASVTKSLFETVITTYKSHHCGRFIDDVRIKAEPLEVYAEDTFIYRLVSLTESFAPPPQFSQHQNLDNREAVVISVGRQILYPINIGTIEVEDLKILLSIHASLKMYLSADHMPVVLGKFTCHPTRTIQKELTRKILYHYLTQALVRAGLMLGSLEILANPTGLIRSVGQGIADFFSLPYDGLTRGPSAFVSGISSGIGSFFRHASVGALTSMTNFASSLSRNMDRLSLDEEHMIRQEEQRCRTASQVWPGFSRALFGFGVSLLGAVAGIVDHPITSIQNAETTRDAFKGAARGLGKGLVGVVAKPIGGVMELVSQTGQGILVGTGLTKLPKKLRSALDKADILGLDRESYMKYFWKVIRVEFEEYTNLFVITDVSIRFSSDQSGYDGAVILTPGAFYLYDRSLNNIRMAFACNEVNLRVDHSTPYQMYLEKVGRQREVGYCYDQMADIKPDDIQCSRDSNKDSTISQSPTIDISYPIILQMQPTYVKLLLSQFCHQKDLFEESVTDQVLEVASFN